MALFIPPPAAGLALQFPLPQQLSSADIVRLADEIDLHNSAALAAMRESQRRLSFIAYEMLDRYDSDLEDHLNAEYIDPLSDGDSHLSEAHRKHVMNLLAALLRRADEAPDWSEPVGRLAAAAERMSTVCSRVRRMAGEAHRAARVLLARETRTQH